ncbi:MAG: hypothetical protein Q9175_001728 [Cornicularia normoerica]
MPHPAEPRRRIQAGQSPAANWNDDLDKRTVTSTLGCDVLCLCVQSLPFCPFKAIQTQGTCSFQLSMPQPLRIMFCGHLFSILSLYAGGILAKPLQIAAKKTPSPFLSLSLINTTFISNISTGSPALNTSAENALSIECNGALYGFNPNIADCEGAARMIEPNSEEIIWGQRHTGLPRDTFPLPFAVFGDRAECAVYTGILGGSRTARASLTQVKSAAAALSLQCAAGGQSQGGIATNIGGDNNLAVVLAPYEPNIQCGSAEAFTHPPSCGGILVDMPASTAEMRFGPRGVPGVNEPLPQYIASGSSPLVGQIRPRGIVSGRPRWRRLRGVPDTGGLAISGDWVCFSMLGLNNLGKSTGSDFLWQEIMAIFSSH